MGQTKRPVVQVETLEKQEREELLSRIEEMRTHYEALLRDQDSVLLEQDALFHLRVMEELQQKVSSYMLPTPPQLAPCLLILTRSTSLVLAENCLAARAD